MVRTLVRRGWHADRVDSTEWDARYAASDLLWSAAPNRWVESELAGLAPGRALDLAAGEGRNALWLAGLGWQVTAVDFSAVALAKGRAVAAADERAARIEWVHADLLDYVPAAGGFDAVVMAYLQLPARQRAAVHARAAVALAPGGVLLVVAHDLANLTDGVGGPGDAQVLFSAADVRADLAASGVALSVERAGAVRRPVAGEQRPAIDVLVRATRAR
jgi:SAM-dependent methyltransferase